MATRILLSSTTRFPTFLTIRLIWRFLPSFRTILKRVGERILTRAGRVLLPRIFRPFSKAFKAPAGMGSATTTRYSFSWSKEGCVRRRCSLPSLVRSRRPVESLVEAADRVHPLLDAFEQVHHDLFPRMVAAGDVTSGLVQGDVYGFLLQRQLFSLDYDPVPVGIDFCSQLGDDIAVDCHLALDDQCFGMAPGAVARS